MAVEGDEKFQQVYKRLKAIRERDDLTLKPLKHLKDTFTHADGSERPFHLRYYQIQGILHMSVLSRFVLGDDTGLGKSLMTIAAMCTAWQKKPNQKVIIITDKSAVLQWCSEFAKFSTGVQTFPYEGGPKKRVKVREAFLEAEGPSVLVMNYAKARVDMSHLQDWRDYILVLDEVQACKSPTSNIHRVCAIMSHNASRCYGLTATLLGNNLMEGFGIFKVVKPNLFTSKNQFMHRYGIVEKQMVPGKFRPITKVVGHTEEQIEAFKAKIDPYYLGRAKFQVAKELPTLTIKNVDVPMSKFQEAKYMEILSGILETPEGEKETTKLTQIIYCLQAVDSPNLLPGLEDDPNIKSPKLDMLLTMLTEGEFAGEKVIVSTRFRRMVDIIMPALKKAKIKAVRITGAETGEKRNNAKKLFQDPKSGVQVVCITDAAKQAVNLQAAKAIIFFDTDFSAGVYIQKIGRMIRIGSEHDKCYAIHLRATSGRRAKTVDHRCMEILNKKMKLIERVIGKRIKGEGDEVDPVLEINDISALFESLREDARGGK